MTDDDRKDIDQLLAACGYLVEIEQKCNEATIRGLADALKHVLEDFTECAPHRLLSNHHVQTAEAREVVRYLQDIVRGEILACWRHRHDVPEPE